jgi:arylsulfatase
MAGPEEAAVGDLHDVVVADYPSLEPARSDFDALVREVGIGAVVADGVILVEHDAEGHVRVLETGDHLGRTGEEWDGGVSLVVGLLSPGMLASVVPESAAGHVVGRFERHQADTGIDRHLGDRLQPGTVAVVAVVDDADRASAQRALAHCPAELLLPVDRKTLDDLRDLLGQHV